MLTATFKITNNNLVFTKTKFPKHKAPKFSYWKVLSNIYLALTGRAWTRKARAGMKSVVCLGPLSGSFG